MECPECGTYYEECRLCYIGENHQECIGGGTCYRCDPVSHQTGPGDLSTEASGYPAFTYEYDPDTDYMEIFVDGISRGEWYCEVEPQEMLKEFERVFVLGMSYKKAG